LLGDKAIIGFSTHSLEQVERAPFDEIDYIGFGPIFDSQTKPGANPTVGIDLLRKAVQLSKVPVVAIGGIVVGTAAEVYKTGAASAAVIRDLEIAADLKDRVGEYLHLAAQVSPRREQERFSSRI
jgi:thiamine-phosphate pyrophosphorylase